MAIGRVNTGSSGSKIKGQGEYIGTYIDDINKGDLVTTRRYFGFDDMYKLPNPVVTMTASTYSVGINSDASIIVYGTMGTSNLQPHKRIGDELVKLPVISGVSSQTVNAIKFSIDDKYMFVGYSSSPFLKIFEVNGDTFKEINSFDAVTSSVLAIEFSGDGSQVFIGTTSAPYLQVYNIIGSEFRKGDPVANTPTTQVRDLSLSGDGKTLIVGLSSSPFLFAYDRIDGVLTRVTNIDAMTSGSGQMGWGVATYPDGSIFVVVHRFSPYLEMYKRDGNSFKKLPKPPLTINGAGNACSLTSDGQYLAVSSEGSPYMYMFKVEGESLTRLSNPAIIPMGEGKGISFARNAPYLVYGHDSSPYMTVFKSDILGEYIHKYSGFGDLSKGNFVNFGVAKSPGAANSTNKKITTIPIK
ncbi:WD40 repeat domain-containing protein [Peribacillus loiseleuriae]|uniref:Uncharacterized protein n=1 Tax=Peribacillus loiseleuriae TaxID=1679170 RepID=A0A0K9GRG3_9BACI|nr:WD40 repeat domain-containing protein [Peribacillus loiseleuriae]KMY49245.1 hypothetical protein AC625_06680 [Peribacillus loiseleuriae]